jgi:hypothetical protein
LEHEMSRMYKSVAFLSLMLLFPATTVLAQSGSFSSITAISSPQPPAPIPIFAINRFSNVVTVSTVDPSNPDEYAQQNQVGASVTIANVTADPSNGVNGTFPICGPPMPGCVAPTTYSFSYLSNGADFSASGQQLGLTAVARAACPLTPTGYFSFCGDSRPGAGLSYATDGSLMEIISTQDQVGGMLWASALGDGNSGTNRVTGCEQSFIESGNEWHFECDWKRNFGGYIDIDMKNQWLVMDVGNGVSARGVGGEFAMTGTRSLASFGVLNSRTLLVDMGATPPGSVMPNSGVLRFRNGSSVCWENAVATNALCQTTDPQDRFSFGGGVVAPAFSTATSCANFWGQCGSAPAGSIGLSPGANSIVISTTAVTAQSQIFVQEDSSLAGVLGVTCNNQPGRSYLITNRTPGVSFEIIVSSAPASNPACLSYHLLN